MTCLSGRTTRNGAHTPWSSMTGKADPKMSIAYKSGHLVSSVVPHRRRVLHTLGDNQVSYNATFSSSPARLTNHFGAVLARYRRFPSSWSAGHRTLHLICDHAAIHVASVSFTQSYRNPPSMSRTVFSPAFHPLRRQVQASAHVSSVPCSCDMPPSARHEHPQTQTGTWICLCPYSWPLSGSISSPSSRALSNMTARWVCFIKCLFSMLAPSSLACRGNPAHTSQVRRLQVGCVWDLPPSRNPAVTFSKDCVLLQTIS
jgi:hypothetical protein